ncbi:MoaD/ThiS family protein [Brachybacterium huguangmaarense]|uniref:MoaD/ThiS family protein n=1 Tax=Brachybacterium huguangmaarense TaxID=1652028 RepID=A0ABY6G1Q2_9MICO|nr:MoaD/ThiS family protein [Brachybacterium huguangmaarense]UYG17136.1 MoaD/ThiS family protein [Brachybacterium huguangmaarense]
MADTEPLEQADPSEHDEPAEDATPEAAASEPTPPTPADGGTDDEPHPVPLIEVRLFAAAAAALGTDLAEAPGRTVAEVIAALSARTDAEGARVLGRSSVLVNAVACRDHDRRVFPGDRLDVLPPFAGG